MDQKGYPMNAKPTTHEARLADAKARHNPKAETPKVTSPATAPTNQTGDQKPVPATPSGDQKDAKAKTKKKLSATVVEWHRITKAKEAATGTIRLTDKGKADKPKRAKAMDRFKLYRDGMTVAEYIEESHKAGNSKALAQADVRWDVAKGLITVS
jgi:hypothetical protein